MDLQLYQVERAPRDLPIWPLIFDDLGRPTAKRLAKVLGVSERTARRWIASGTAPRAVCMALYWLTRWGRSQLDADAYNDANMALSLARGLKRERDYLRGQVHHLKADRDAWRTRLAQTLKRLDGPEAEPEAAEARGEPEVPKMGLPGRVTRPSRCAELVGTSTEPARNGEATTPPAQSQCAPRCVQARPKAPPAPSQAAQSAFSALVMAAVTHAPQGRHAPAHGDTRGHTESCGEREEPAPSRTVRGARVDDATHCEAQASGASPLYWGQAPSPPAAPSKRGRKNSQRRTLQEVPQDHPWLRWKLK